MPLVRNLGFNTAGTKHLTKAASGWEWVFELTVGEATVHHDRCGGRSLRRLLKSGSRGGGEGREKGRGGR